MKLAVIGATGQLGRAILDTLVARGMPADEVMAIGRNKEVLDELATRGFDVAAADMNAPESIEVALAGADDLLLISGSEVGRRLDQHKSVIDAAARAGVKRIAYTGVVNTDSPALLLAAEHRSTEDHLRASGLGYTMLRNAWYTENHHADFLAGATAGKIISNIGDGHIATASRQDLAEAAAVVLADLDTHEGNVYELSGDVAWTYAEFAVRASDSLGREVVYEPVDDAAYGELLRSTGLDEQTAGLIVAINANVRENLLAGTSEDLARLIGRPTTTLADTVDQWAAELTASTQN